MAELSFGGFRLLTVFWCHWEVLLHLQYHSGLSGQQELSLILVFLPLAFNSLCLQLVKITKSCKKFEKFLYLQANSLVCHDLMDAGRRLEVPGLQTTDFITYRTADSLSFMFTLDLFPN